jgi:hypothetical protein
MANFMSERQVTFELVIRAIADSDRELWEPLWKGYLDFYEKTIPQETTEFT